MNIAPDIENKILEDPTETILGEEWDSEAIVRLIRRNSPPGQMPTILMLGKKEATLLRAHLANAFGAEELSKLAELHYAGLKVVETEVESLVKVAGERMLPEFKRITRQVPVWKDESDQSRWRHDARFA